MNYRKFTGEKLSGSFLARIKEYYPNDNPLKSGKDSVIFKDITKTPTKQNTYQAKHHWAVCFAV